MKYTDLFGKTQKSSKEYDTKNASLLTKAGFVNQLMAGVYTYLPLGIRTLQKIENIVRSEMNTLGAQEILMPMLNPSENWKQTGAWNSVDVLFKLNSRTQKEYALAQSAEEVVVPLMKEYIYSSKDLPILPYQINWKFRDELRAKSGIMRGREFLMKDMYSLHKTQAEFEAFYEEAKGAYMRVFDRMNLDAKVTKASGGNFTQKISYEFMVITNAGEDDILYSKNSDYCINAEISTQKAGEMSPDGSGELFLGMASEVGNVFDLGTRYQELFDIKIQTGTDEFTRGIMGCYGIGISRLMGVIVETHNDEHGIVWPESVAPFQIHLVTIAQSTDDESYIQSNLVYNNLVKQGVEVLWDNRIDVRAGEKFADADLIGIPNRYVISEKSLASGGIEVKKRSENEFKIIPIDFIV